jgi:hypothetical protein
VLAIRRIDDARAECDRIFRENQQLVLQHKSGELYVGGGIATIRKQSEFFIHNPQVVLIRELSKRRTAASCVADKKVYSNACLGELAATLRE